MIKGVEFFVLVLCYWRLKLGMLLRFLKAMNPIKQAANAASPPKAYSGTTKKPPVVTMSFKRASVPTS